MPLNDLLLAAQALGPAYGAPQLRLSNHLPMTLLALDRLGADEARLQAFFDRYRSRLEPASGDRGFVDRRARYAAQIEAEGIEATLRQAVPLLLPQLGAAAFHCAIRTAYAIEAELPQEIASALAYWASTPFGAPQITACGTLSVGAALAAARANEALRFEIRHGTTIQSEMEAAFALPAFVPAAQSVAPEQITLRNLAEAALAIYLDRGDFTALHLVTGAHAARLLSLYADASAVAARLWPALLAAYVSIGRPQPRFDLVHAPLPAIDWPALRAAARQAGDEHAIKIAYSASCEWQVYRWPGYAAAAGRQPLA
jgi:hypothetical protein